MSGPSEDDADNGFNVTSSVDNFVKSVAKDPMTYLVNPGLSMSKHAPGIPDTYNKLRMQDDLSKDALIMKGRKEAAKQAAYTQTLADILSTRRDRPGAAAQTLLTSSAQPGKNSLLTIKGSGR